MPRKRYEEEIEEILEKMDPVDGRVENKSPEESRENEKTGRLIPWEDVPKSRSEPRRARRRRSSGAFSIVITPTRLIVAAVFVVVFVLATNFWPLMIVALLLFGGAYYMNKRRGGPGLLTGTRQRKYSRDSPIDFDDEDPDDRDGSGGPNGGTSGGNRWRGG